jgi:hypothetical protein
MQDRGATVLIRHISDVGSAAIAAELANIGTTRILNDYFEFVIEQQESLSTDFDVRHFSGEGVEECKLLDRLSRLGSIGVIRLVCVDGVPGSSDPEVVVGISEAVKQVRISLGQLLGSRVRVIEVRVGIRGFGEQIPPSEFFPISTDANVLVIPHDRISDSGMARPISRGESSADSHTFALHGAVEMASVLGLWKSMKHAPIDGFVPSVAGSAISRVRFSQSRVRILIGPPLPMTDLANPDSDLPLPLQHFAATNIERAVNDLVAEIYPGDLCFNKSDEPDFTREVAGGVRGFLHFVGEFGRSLLLLPRLVVKGLKGELDAAASNFYQGMLSDDTLVRVIGATGSRGNEKVGLSSGELEKLMEEVLSRADREIVSPLMREHWAQILGRCLGSVDGSSATREVRQQVFGNENILLVSRDAIGSCEDTLEAQVARLMASNGTSQPAEPLTDFESEVIAEPQDDGPIGDVDINVGDSQSLDLVVRLSSRFELERRSATAHAQEMVQKIRLIASELKPKDADSLSSSVIVAAWVSLCAVVFVLLTCTPLSNPLSFSSLSGYVRDALWALFSGVFVIAAVLLLGYGGKRTWQVRALTTGCVSGVIIALGIVWFDDLRAAVRVGRGNYLGAASLGVVTLLLLGFAVFRNLKSQSETRRQLGRLFLLFTSIYLLASLVLWQSMESSALQTAESSTRVRVLWAVVIVAGIMLISCLGVVTLFQIRERLRLRINARVLEWSRQELETAIEAERILAAAKTQWIATGSVLSRLLTHPLGKQITGDREVSESLSSDESILKYDVARLNLNDRGDAGLAARLRRHFVEPGWLVRQYEKMVKRFQEQAAFTSGNQLEDLIERRPEIDPSVVTPKQALTGRPEGDRWDFARRVFAGQYDADLGAVPQQLDLEEVYQSVLDTPSSYELSGSQLPGATAREFLEQVLPTPGVELATGLTKRVFTAGDELRKMKSEIWWPNDILGEPPVNDNMVKVNSSDSELSSFFGGSVLLVGIRVDFSEPFTYVECEGAVDLQQGGLQIEVGESGQSDF